jgi:hypothetical protein
MLKILRPFEEGFFYSGVLRTLMSTQYDLNFIIFLELSKPHFSSGDLLLYSSSLFGLLIFALESYAIYRIVNEL